MMERQAELEAIAERYGREPTALLQVLREAQEIEGWLPPATLTRVAKLLGLPRARVEGVAGFYSFLHPEPAGRYRVLFSDNITDRMAGNVELFEHFCHGLWLERGKTSEDGLVLADLTSCTGMCDQGPAILVNGWAMPRITQARLDRVIELIRSLTPVEDWPAELFLVEDNIRRKDILLSASPEPGEAIRAAIEREFPGDEGSPSPAGRSAAPVSPPGSSGRPAATRRARSVTWCATPTRASRGPSRTGCCSRATRTWCSRA